MSQSDNDIENYDIENYDNYGNDGVSNVIRAILVSLSIIGCMLFTVYFFYKYSVCLQKKNIKDNISVKQYAMV